jgi:hypothetical protein
MDKPLSESIDHNVDTPSKTEMGYSAAESRYSLKEQRHIIHKVDRRLITALGLLLCVSLVDRTNLGNAMISGYFNPSVKAVFCFHADDISMEKELRMEVGSRYVRS